MLITVQFPFADVRSFTSNETFRLKEPRLPFINPHKFEFIRSFGQIEYRKLGGLSFDDHVFSKANRALRLPQFSNKEIGRLILKPINRRLYSDGEVLCRIESCFRSTNRATLARYQIYEIIRDFLDLTVIIPTNNSYKTLPLKYAGKQLASLYLYATTNLTEGLDELIDYWVEPGNPMILIEENDMFEFELPLHRKFKAIKVFENDEMSLNHLLIYSKNLKINVWLIKKNNSNYDKESIRRLRLCILRTHAELECLKQVLRLISQGKIGNFANRKVSDALQNYINTLITNISRPQRYGIQQHEILNIYKSYENFINVHERDILLNQLKTIRINLFRNLEKFTEPREIADPNIFKISGTENMYFVTSENIQFGGKSMTNVKLKIGDNNVFHGNVAVAEVINDSFNKLDTTKDIDRNLSAMLTELTTLISKLCEQLPPVNGEEVARDLQTLITESTNPTPRKKWYELSADGILEAAKTCAALVEPITKTVKQILWFLNTGSFNIGL
jgi:hypothetical protein